MDTINVFALGLIGAVGLSPHKLPALDDVHAVHGYLVKRRALLDDEPRIIRRCELHFASPRHRHRLRRHLGVLRGIPPAAAHSYQGRCIGPTGTPIRFAGTRKWTVSLLDLFSYASLSFPLSEHVLHAGTSTRGLLSSPEIGRLVQIPTAGVNLDHTDRHGARTRSVRR